jgi:DNA replication protein DnaC
MSRREALKQNLKALSLPSALEVVDELLACADRETWTPEVFTTVLTERELDGRRQRRIERLTKAAGLPVTKTMASLEMDRLPQRVQRQLPQLCSGDFVDRAENVLAFGLPGRGKTHALAALGHELVLGGRTVLFSPTFRIVDRLLRAKRDLELDRELRRLDRFELLILDDFGYVQQSREEMEVLFTLLAERYERRSVAITSNLVFSEWDRIFKDPLTTASAIDRVVHHSIILEFGAETTSFRAEQANRRNKEAA